MFLRNEFLRYITQDSAIFLSCSIICTHFIGQIEMKMKSADKERKAEKKFESYNINILLHWHQVAHFPFATTDRFKVNHLWDIIALS